MSERPPSEVATVFGAFQRAGERVCPRFHRVLILLPSAYAALLGIAEWLFHRSDPLQPDAQAFLAWADSFGPLSLVGGTREPVWVALMALPVRLVGPSPDVPRLLGVSGFVLMVGSFQLVAERLYGRNRAAIAAAILATSPWLTFQAAEGLREETSAALLLLFGIGVVSVGKDTKRIAGLAFFVGLIAMLRWDTLLITLPVSAVALAVHRVQIRYWVMSVAVVAVVVSLLVIGNWVRYGDPMYHSNIHARFFRNVEFQDKPGFLTSQEVAANNFAGPSVTWAGYLFGLHTPAQLAKRTVVGTVRIVGGEAYYSLFYPEKPFEPHQIGEFLLILAKVTLVALLVLLGVVGGLFLLPGPTWPLGVILLLSIVEFTPIGDMCDLRLAITTIPFTLLGILETLALLTQRWQRGPVVARLRHLARLGGSTSQAQPPRMG